MPNVPLSLQAPAAAAVDRLGVGADDDVLVLFNEPQREVAEAIAAACRGRARSVRDLVFPTSERPTAEPPPFVSEAMAAATAVFAATASGISHTQARLAATRRGVRIATLTRITKDVFTGGALLADYNQLKRSVDALAARLTAASECRITSPAGTDVRLTLTGRKAVCDAGDLDHDGAFGNLPAGEAYIAPIETTGRGVIVFDGSLAGHGLLRKPLRITLEEGRIVAADGEAAQWLLAALDSGGSSGRTIAELGSAPTHKPRLTGTILEDEKAAGTAHLAFGMNASFGGANVADIHIDGLIRTPTIELDGRLLLSDGVVESND